MIYIYIKTHNKTGLKYLGQTTSKNPHAYTGSGKYWKLHLQKHGKDYTTEILKECRTREETRYWGEYYSKLWNVVESDAWANLKAETGDGGWPKDAHLGIPHSQETKEKISKSKTGITPNRVYLPKTEEEKHHLRKLNLGKKRSAETSEKIKQTKLKNPYKHSEEIKQKMRKPKSAEGLANMRKAYHPGTSGKIWIHNGIEEKMIIDTSILEAGWVRGKISNTAPPSQKGKRWANNGVVNKMVLEIPEGWNVGKLKKLKEK